MRLTTRLRALCQRAPRAGWIAVALLALAAVCTGCAGGQSGSEGACPEGMIQRTGQLDGSTQDAIHTFDNDDDGGVAMEPDADATLIANTPEGSDGPLQCIAPQD